jgi:hypothetical protein
MANVRPAAAINLIIVSSYLILGLPNEATDDATTTHGTSTSLFVASFHWPHRPEIA